MLRNTLIRLGLCAVTLAILPIASAQVTGKPCEVTIGDAYAGISQTTSTLASSYGMALSGLDSTGSFQFPLCRTGQLLQTSQSCMVRCAEGFVPISGTAMYTCGLDGLIKPTLECAKQCTLPDPLPEHIIGEAVAGFEACTPGQKLSTGRKCGVKCSPGYIDYESDLAKLSLDDHFSFSCTLSGEGVAVVHPKMQCQLPLGAPTASPESITQTTTQCPYARDLHCFDATFTCASCCTTGRNDANAPCWDETFTFDRCCNGGVGTNAPTLGWQGCIENSAPYRGCQSVTRSGKICQKWSAQTPHQHSNTPELKPGLGLDDGNGNYCRDPDPEMGQTTPWCYTTDPSTAFEYCDPLEGAIPTSVVSAPDDRIVPNSQCEFVRDLSCFDEVYTCSRCCTSGLSIYGLSCWDDAYTPQRCCLMPGQTEAPTMAPLKLFGESAAPASFQSSSGAQCPYEADASCFSSAYPCESCCLDGKSSIGGSCWDAEYTPGRCCKNLPPPTSPPDYVAATSAPIEQPTTAVPAPLWTPPVSTPSMLLERSPWCPEDQCADPATPWFRGGKQSRCSAVKENEFFYYCGKTAPPPPTPSPQWAPPPSGASPPGTVPSSFTYPTSWMTPVVPSTTWITPVPVTVGGKGTPATTWITPVPVGGKGTPVVPTPTWVAPTTPVWAPTWQSPAPPASGASCEDTNPMCAAWYTMPGEYCTSMETFMRTACAKTCGFCT